MSMDTKMCGRSVMIKNCFTMVISKIGNVLQWFGVRSGH